MDADGVGGAGLGVGSAALHEGGAGELGAARRRLALLAFAAFSFAVGAWRYAHMGRSLAEAKIAQVKSWLVLAATLFLFIAALIAVGSALLLW